MLKRHRYLLHGQNNEKRDIYFVRTNPQEEEEQEVPAVGRWGGESGIKQEEKRIIEKIRQEKVTLLCVALVLSPSIAHDITNTKTIWQSYVMRCIGPTNTGRQPYFSRANSSHRQCMFSSFLFIKPIFLPIHIHYIHQSSRRYLLQWRDL